MRDSERGVALLTALVTVTVMSVLALGVARTALTAETLTRHTREALQAEALLRSAVTVASVALERHARSGFPDTLHLAGPRRHHLGDGWVEVEVEDAARRIDLNAPALRPALQRLVGGLGLRPELVDTLADWTDPDDTARRFGAESAWYALRPTPLAPTNGPLTNPAHLRFVRGFDADALARLAPHVTVAGEGTINPNTAGPVVLGAWVGDPRETRRLLAARARDVQACGARPQCTVRSSYYLVHVRAEVGRIERRATVTLLVPNGLPAGIHAWWPLPTAVASVQDGGGAELRL